MTIELRDVSRDNWLQCVRLEVRQDQKGFVASNAFSLAQAAYDPIWLPQAIYDGETMVGFVMSTREADPARGWWICRLMVEKAHQGRGYGRAAVQEVLRRMAASPGRRDVYISEKPENNVAAGLYQSLGFVKTGDMEDGEEVQKYILPDRT